MLVFVISFVYVLSLGTTLSYGIFDKFSRLGTVSYAEAAYNTVLAIVPVLNSFTALLFTFRFYRKKVKDLDILSTSLDNH